MSSERTAACTCANPGVLGHEVSCPAYPYRTTRQMPPEKPDPGYELRVDLSDHIDSAASPRRVTDSTGITVEYRPLHALQPGDRIAGGWRPWAVVKAVEAGTRDLGSVTYEDGASVAFPPDQEFPVVVYDPKDESSAARVLRERVEAQRERDASAATVYAVEWGNEFPAEIDSLWTTEEEAQKRANERNSQAGRLGGGWGVAKWELQTTWQAESNG